jgi:hypothetical protein
MSDEFVARPKHPKSRYNYSVIMRTADTDRAVRLLLNGRTPNGMASSLRQWLEPRGYRLHYSQDGDALLVWVERRGATS